ncbi:MAG: DUF1846 domain-containing protein [Defluviitaleaceae bacterium]|nr:DUF1846 domain-containing protein [Defluviitaleaceae bacterium]
MYKLGFNNENYLKMQSEHIFKRINQFENKLYLEFGGKLFDDYHASRVLPGFAHDNKIKLLKTMGDKVEIVIAINSADIEKNKIRGDLGITYGVDVFRLIDAFRGEGLFVGSVVVTQYKPESSVEVFVKYLEKSGIKVYKHYTIQDYPTNIAKIVSEEGFGKNEYIETQRELVVITAPGPGSGKMAVCLSQLYHEHIRNLKAGYAKFETFPVWNLPLSHPVNMAYEAATIDLDDINMIDPFHLESYGGETAINYNRDIDIFPVLYEMFKLISGDSPYKSPTDMGVNMVGFCIDDDDVCKSASRQEIIRRYYQLKCDVKINNASLHSLQKLELLMKKADIDVLERSVATAAIKKAEESTPPALAIELSCGTIITGKTTDLLGAASSALLNALKHLAGVPKDVKLIPSEIIRPIQKLKTGFLGNSNPRLHTDEVLMALSIHSVNDKASAKVLSMLPKLYRCEAHSTVILSSIDANVFKKLGVNITMEDVYETKKLFRKN